MFGKQKAQIAGNDSSSDISRDVFTELGGLGQALFHCRSQHERLWVVFFSGAFCSSGEFY